MTAPHHFIGDTLVIASHNKGKVREIADLLESYVKTLATAGELGLPEPEETGATFVANAELKARAAAAAGHVALADDSGLVVPALGGAPGIYSARWAGPDKDFAMAMRKVEDGLAGKADRSAYFVCALSLAWPDGHVETVEGRCHGTLVWPARGLHGFGYDPIFQPNGHTISFGEMDPVAKHGMNHRADAFRQLVERGFQ